MSEKNFSQMLRELSNDYYYNSIPFDTYRSRRKLILDKIDEEFNGWDDNDNKDEELSKLMQTVKFFKNDHF